MVQTFDKISTEFCGIFCVFVNITGFRRFTLIRGSATARNIRSPVYYRSYLSNPTSPPSPLKMNVRVLTKIFNQFIKMMPYSRPKFSGFYTLSQAKLLQNHTLDSSTYLELNYNSTPPPLHPHPWLGSNANTHHPCLPYPNVSIYRRCIKRM